MNKETDFAAALVREKNARIADLEATNAELLEALEALEDIVEGLGATVENDGNKRIWANAFAAIAKAKGTDPYFVGGRV